jgi:hypothetical protein
MRSMKSFDAKTRDSASCFSFHISELMHIMTRFDVKTRNSASRFNFHSSKVSILVLGKNMFNTQDVPHYPRIRPRTTTQMRLVVRQALSRVALWSIPLSDVVPH